MVSSNTALPNSRDGVSNPYPPVIAAIWSGAGPAALVASRVAGATGAAGAAGATGATAAAAGAAAGAAGAAGADRGGGGVVASVTFRMLVRTNRGQPVGTGPELVVSGGTRMRRPRLRR